MEDSFANFSVTLGTGPLLDLGGGIVCGGNETLRHPILAPALAADCRQEIPQHVVGLDRGQLIGGNGTEHLPTRHEHVHRVRLLLPESFALLDQHLIVIALLVVAG